MMTNNKSEKKIFSFNMSFYYQSTIIYFIVFVIYAVIQGQFIENSFTLITRDPVVYFFSLVVVLSILSLLYNLYLNRHIEITEKEIIFKRGSWEKIIKFEDITSIRITREKKHFKATAFTLVQVRTKEKKLPITIRPYDYENSHLLMEEIKELKNRVGN
ncbi:MAG: hypothetical protein NTX22_14155 [Ignavibacteriales bacterium]|nr:hypothetical protein [Ignavibacteriales bacterium]